MTSKLTPKLTRNNPERNEEMQHMSDEIGNNLRTIRKDKQYSGQFVADAIGVPSRTLIYNYEKGRVLIPLDRLINILDLYNYDIIEFIKITPSLQTRLFNKSNK